MKSRRFKKGFTLVELLVVIAILAVLEGVSVIAYFGFTSQARTSADEQAVTQMNIALEAQEAIDPPEGVEEAKKVLSDAGFTVDDYVPLDKDNIFYYDDEEIRVLIFDQEEKKVTFPQELANVYSGVSAKQGFWFPLNDKTYVWEDLNQDSLGSNSFYYGDEFIKKFEAADDTTLFKLSEDFRLTTEYFNGWFSGTYYFPVNSNGKANLDLGGHTLSISCGVEIGGYVKGDALPQEAEITISNGTLVIGNYTHGFNINENSSLSINNCKIVTPSNSNMKEDYNQFNVADGGRLTLAGCTVEATEGNTCSVFLGGEGSETNILNSSLTSTTYGITSNAGEGQSNNIGLKIYNSTVTALEGPSILVNVKGTYTFEDSAFTGNGIGVSIRGGNATIDNCNITITGDNTSTQDDLVNNGSEAETVGKETWEFALIRGFADGAYGDGKFNFTNSDGTWASGLGVQFGALVLGDWNFASYNYDTTCTLTDTEIHMDDAWTALPIVYLAQDGDRATTLNYDSACKFSKGGTAYSTADALVKIGSQGEPLAVTDTNKIGALVVNAI